MADRPSIEARIRAAARARAAGVAPAAPAAAQPRRTGGCGGCGKKKAGQAARLEQREAESDSNQVVSRRMLICGKCEHFRVASDRRAYACSICQCADPAKLRPRCPAGKWGLTGASGCAHLVEDHAAPGGLRCALLQTDCAGCASRVAPAFSPAPADNETTHGAGKDGGATGAPEDIVIRSVLAAGDAVVLSAAIRDLHRCAPGRFRTAVEVCDGNEVVLSNPNVTQREEMPGASVVEANYPAVQRSNQRKVHFLAGYIEDLAQKFGLPLKLTEFCPDLHLTDSEKATRPMDRPYWLLLAGGKSDYSAKVWPAHRWQQVVNMLAGQVTFLQAGHAEHGHPPLEGVVDARGETSLRQLIQLVYHSEGVCCGITGAMHMAAAFNKPCVVVAGGREPYWWEAYTRETREATMRHFDKAWQPPTPDLFVEHRFLHTVGTADLPCCDKIACWRSKVTDGEDHERCERLRQERGALFPECLARITPEQVAKAVLSYSETARPATTGLPTLRVYANMACRGGGEHSTITLMRQLRGKLRIIFHPLTRIDESWRAQLFGATDAIAAPSACGPGEHALIYANDAAGGLDSPEWRARLKEAASVQIVLNYVLGAVPKCAWLEPNLKAVYFLNAIKESEWRRAVANGPLADVPTHALPPPVDLARFLAAAHPQVKDGKLVVARLGGSAAKLPPDAADWYARLAERLPQARWHFMPAPSVLEPLRGDDRFHLFARDQISVETFLGATDIFAYPVDDRVRDQGPRVVMEAMAAGCCVVAENRDGCADRIEHGVSGILCANRAAMAEEIVRLAAEPERRVRLGAAARARASAWTVEAWTERIIAGSSAGAQRPQEAKARPVRQLARKRAASIAVAYSLNGSHKKHFGREGYFDIGAQQHYDMLRLARAAMNGDTKYPEILAVVNYQNDVPADLSAMTLAASTTPADWQNGALFAIRQALQAAAGMGSDWLCFTAEDIIPAVPDFIGGLYDQAAAQGDVWFGQLYAGHICTQVFMARVDALVFRGRCVIPDKTPKGCLESHILNWLNATGRQWHHAPAKQYYHERDLAAMKRRMEIG